MKKLMKKIILFAFCPISLIAMNYENDNREIGISTHLLQVMSKVDGTKIINPLATNTLIYKKCHDTSQNITDFEFITSIDDDNLLPDSRYIQTSYHFHPSIKSVQIGHPSSVWVRQDNACHINYQVETIAHWQNTSSIDENVELAPGYAIIKHLTANTFTEVSDLKDLDGVNKPVILEDSPCGKRFSYGKTFMPTLQTTDLYKRNNDMAKCPLGWNMNVFLVIAALRMQKHDDDPLKPVYTPVSN